MRALSPPPRPLPSPLLPIHPAITNPPPTAVYTWAVPWDSHPTIAPSAQPSDIATDASGINSQTLSIRAFEAVYTQLPSSTGGTAPSVTPGPTLSSATPGPTSSSDAFSAAPGAASNDGVKIGVGVGVGVGLGLAVLVTVGLLLRRRRRRGRALTGIDGDMGMGKGAGEKAELAGECLPRYESEKAAMVFTPAPVFEMPDTSAVAELSGGEEGVRRDRGSGGGLGGEAGGGGRAGGGRGCGGKDGERGEIRWSCVVSGVGGRIYSSSDSLTDLGDEVRRNETKDGSGNPGT